MRRAPRIETGRRHAAGFSLLELCAAMAIVAVLLAVAVPNYSSMIQRKQLRGTADALVQDLRNARELSVNTQSRIFVSYRAGQRWCWGVSRGTPCDCSGASPLPACNIRRADHSEFPDVLLDGAQDGEFEPGLGQVTQHGAADFRTTKGHTLRVVLNALGRTQVCGPDAPGAQPC